MSNLAVSNGHAAAGWPSIIFFAMSENRINKLIKVGITHGDINGVGYEVILKALDDQRMTELFTPVIYGSAKIAAFYRKGLALQGGGNLRQVDSAADAREGEVNIVNVIGEDVKVDPGQSTQAAGEAAFAALERAVEDLKNGEIDVIVTAPINKHNIHSETFSFPGHTEYLEASLGGEGDKALMILCNDDIRVALATTHLPVTRIADALTVDSILEKLDIFNRSLKRDFGVTTPRIAVLALNPHAGDSGVIGSEEADIIIPAIEAAKQKKIVCFGPYGADGFFGSGAYRKFDGILAMYHDQGLAPFKVIAMESGINFTAGLPYVRTSPDHGTAYDIAGRGEASEISLREAIYKAIDIVRRRERYDRAHRHPLRKQYYDKKHDDVTLDLTKDDPAD